MFLSSALRLFLVMAAAVAAQAKPGVSCAARVQATGVKGTFAFVRSGVLEELTLPDCRVRKLAGSANAPVSFSPDGRYLAFGDGAVLASRGGPELHPAGRARMWAWSPGATALVAVRTDGTVSVWRPGTPARAITASGWDRDVYASGGLAVSPDGRWVAIGRTARAPWVTQELWLVSVRTGTRRRLYRIPTGYLTVAGFTPDGRNVLFWSNPVGSGSIRADGLPLEAVSTAGGRPRTLVSTMLVAGDFLTACGRSLVAVAGAGRETNQGKWLAQLAPPDFRARSLGLSGSESWVDPSCASGGEIAAAAGPSSRNARFGAEHRSIWLIPGRGRPPVRLTTPVGADVSDELPRLSRDGRTILFIRGVSSLRTGQRGELELLTLGADGRAQMIGPLADLGSAGIGYYDAYPWGLLTAWHPA